MNETRGQFTRSNLRRCPPIPSGPTVSIAGVATFGTLSGSPTGRVNKLYEIVDNISHQAGAHALRAGVNFLYNDTTITYPAIDPRQLRVFLAGQLSAGDLQQCGLYANLRQLRLPRRPIPNIGFYAQDEWKVNPRLTLNLGLRYDLQFLKTIATDRNNVSPRAGFAWSPFASRRTVVRGSFGLFYDRVPLRALANALLSSGNTTDSQQHQPDQRESFAHANRRAGLSEHPPQHRPAGRRAGQLHDHGSEHAERLLAAGQLRDRAAARRAQHA